MTRFILHSLGIQAAILPFFIHSLAAQEQLGMRLEGASGMFGATLNPSIVAFQPHAWEVSLFAADVFVENHYAFVRQSSLPRVLSHRGPVVSAPSLSAESDPADNALVLDFFDGSRNMHAVAQTRLSGPGFNIRLDPHQTIGLNTALRGGFSAYRIPGVLAYRNITDLPRNQAIDIAPAGFAGMAWGEVSLLYARQQSSGDRTFAWSIAPKYLTGFEAAYGRVRSNFDYTQRLEDTVAFGSANWDYALTLGNLSTPGQARLCRQGGGFGLDAGMSWAQGQETGGYRWRLGVSLIDLGWVRFHRQSERHHIAFDTLLTVSNADFPPRDNVPQLLSDVSQAFLGQPSASLAGRSFQIALPSAFSVQADLQLSPDFHLAALLVQRVTWSKYQLKRPNTLAIAPRWEHRWWSVSTPLTLNDWHSLRVGLSARLGWLYLGTDHLGSFFTRKQLTGGDFYVGLKVNAFQIMLPERQGLTRETRHKPGRQRLNKIKCYKF